MRPEELHPDAMRALFREQVSGVAVVTVAGSPPCGFTATSVTSVSLRPPIISFCLDVRSSSWRTLETATHVAVNLLQEWQSDIARLFATPGADRFGATRWHPGRGGVPLIDDALAWLECRVLHRIPAGDHVIVLAGPVRARVNGGRPLAYHRGAYVGVRPLSTLTERAEDGQEELSVSYA